MDETTTAIEATGERWFEAEVNRIAGEISLKSLEQDTSKAEDYSARAIAIARHNKPNPGNSAPP